MALSNSLMERFWPRNTLPANDGMQDLIGKHQIKKDISAFCYTLSILFSYVENPGNARKQMKEISTRILEILPQHNEGEVEFINNATKSVTSKQLSHAADKFSECKLNDIIDQDLVRRLRELSNLTSK